MADFIIKGETLVDIANAIRLKDGSTDTIVVSDMAEAIENIPSGGDIDTHSLKTDNGAYLLSKTTYDFLADNNLLSSVEISVSPKTSTSYNYNILYIDYLGGNDSNAIIRDFSKIKVNLNSSENYVIVNKYGIMNGNLSKADLNKYVLKFPTFYNKGSSLILMSGSSIFTSSPSSVKESDKQEILNFLNNFDGVSNKETYASSGSLQLQQVGALTLMDNRDIADKITQLLNSTATANFLTSKASVICSTPYGDSAIYYRLPVFATPNKYNNITNNLFSSTTAFYWCKSFTYSTNNGVPFVLNMKSQTLDFSRFGYGTDSTPSYMANIDFYNNYKNVTPSSVTTIEAASALYEQYKNDPYCVATSTRNVTYDGKSINLAKLFSRYNHDSAVETINSLPDTSAYLATAGGTNTIKFARYSGALTDGGACGDLTEDEIAVATAKGWTVTFVD